MTKQQNDWNLNWNELKYKKYNSKYWLIPASTNCHISWPISRLCPQRPSEGEREDKRTYQTRHVRNKDTQVDEVNHTFFA